LGNSASRSGAIIGERTVSPETAGKSFDSEEQRSHRAENKAVLPKIETLNVAAGYDHSLFLKRDGTVWAVGGNKYGQLGDGTNESRSTAVQVNGMKDVVGIAANGVHSLFLKRDGTVWAVAVIRMERWGTDPTRVAV
jgi:alpha-tubulin suppressor-like RCC1 family protein